MNTQYLNKHFTYHRNIQSGGSKNSSVDLESFLVIRSNNKTGAISRPLIIAIRHIPPIRMKSDI